MSESRESTSEGAAPDGSFEGAFAPLGFPWPTPPTEIPRADSFTPSDASGPQREASDHEGWAAVLIDNFVKDAEARVEALGAAALGGEAGVIEKQAHSLKGSAGNLGAVEVQYLALLAEPAKREMIPPRATCVAVHGLMRDI